MTPTLTLCKMCARLANYQTRAGVQLCHECRDYLLEMGGTDMMEMLRDGKMPPFPVPPWERVARVRAQEFIERELREPIP